MQVHHLEEEPFCKQKGQLGTQSQRWRCAWRVQSTARAGWLEQHERDGKGGGEAPEARVGRASSATTKVNFTAGENRVLTEKEHN